MTRTVKQTLTQSLQNLPTLIKYILIAASVFLISLLYPNNARFQYQFQQGQSWGYDDLYAPFDFPIRKSDNLLKIEKAKIKAEFSPIYEKDSKITEDQVSMFLKEFVDLNTSLQQDTTAKEFYRKSSEYRALGTRILTKYYNRGVIDLDSSQINSPESFVVRIREGGILTPYTLQSLLISRQMNERVVSDLRKESLPEAERISDILLSSIRPNITFDDSLSAQLLEQAIQEISISKGVVKKGELIINKDGIVTADINQRLVSFQQEYENEISEKKSYWGVFIGYFLLTSILIGCLLAFLRFNAPEIYKAYTNLIFLLLWIMAFSYLVFIIDPVDELSVYVIPFCIVPIVLKNFFNERVALFTHLIILLIVSFMTSLGFEFLFINLLAGIVAVLSLSETRDWTLFFRSILFIFLIYTISFIGLGLIQSGNLFDIDYSDIPWLLLNAILTMLAYPLIPLLGKVFGLSSSISLTELADLNRPLLKELSLQAPGTLQHSLQVGNLAEAAAVRVGANSLLVKVGALYHDIGKLRNPAFFVENQQGGFNPHDQIDERQSAKIIVSHVTDGITMAEKRKLPREIIDMIRTHHGTTKCEYFFRNYVKDHPDEKVDETIFSYPGPRPRTKEEAILMMADSLEAASKSMQNPTHGDIEQMVDKIIQGKINNGQFSDSDITFSDIEHCRDVFKAMLKSILHVRIEYPEEE